jgi:rfaE bifunctional protein nucleotidyltransferase chain/domain
VVAVTLDRDGAVVLERDRTPYRTAGRDVESRATIGAGDTFTVAFALALGAGAGAPAAADLAATAAAVVLEQDRTAVCTSHDLVLALHGGDKVTADVEALLRALAARRARGERLVMTNGCFDLLHAGHIAHLREARALGDVLVVGLNGDESTRLLKGEGRPVNGVVERAEVLAAVAAVDHVIPFEGPTAVELIRLLRPDVYVKGGDHRREDLPEACVVEELGGEVRILPYRLTSSTSDTIARIRDGAADGRRPAAPLPSGR